MLGMVTGILPPSGGLNAWSEWLSAPDPLYISLTCSLVKEWSSGLLCDRWDSVMIVQTEMETPD